MPKSEDQKMYDDDFLGQGLHNLFQQLGGMNPNVMVTQLLVKELRKMHKQIGEMINKLEVPAFKGPDPWSILGVSASATHEEVKRAYRAKTSQVHPDRGGSDEQQKLVNLAYELICQLKGWKK